MEEEKKCPNCGREMEYMELRTHVWTCRECGIWAYMDKRGEAHYFPLHEGYGDGECPNCQGCTAWEKDRGYDIPQAGQNMCPICGRNEWFVANRCNTCDHQHCPRIFDDDVWAPGLALIELGA
jgi:hypothetical protein